jgi:aminopeptidase N
VYHWPAHDQNAPAILDALKRSRATFSTLFSPYPYRELRLAEFPRLATFAMGYPTLIPFSESIGFLTRDPKDRTNLNFYVTAHEVAHQWWGTVVWPAHAKGSPVIAEALANYSSLLLAGRVEGEEKRRKMFEDFEDRYLRERDANEELPLVLLDGGRRNEEVIWYNRGGVIFYMMHRQLGEERMLGALREFIRRFSFRDDHPTMTDLLALYEELAPELRPFFDQFVRSTAIPNPRYRRVERRELAGGGWGVVVDVENHGQGDLDLVVAATLGKRDEEGFREAQLVLPLRGTAAAGGEIRCDFKPDAVEMDPDRTVLMQERRRGRREL